MKVNKSDTYLGNKNLKRAYVEIEWTPEKVKEYLKCSKDPVYFIEKYVKIVHVDHGLIPFQPYEFQKEMIQSADDNRFVICKMPRQVGKTTTVVGIILHRILFNEMYSVALLAHKEAQAIEILSRIQLAYEHLPRWMQQGIIEWNKTSVELENGSSIIASSTASSAIRGTSQNLVYLDEFAFVPANIQQTFFSSVYPTISSGKTTKILITSTPNGLNQFYKLWTDSERGKNDFVRVDVHWSDVPGRDEKWKEETIRNTSEEQFRQEYECEFLGSSATLISGIKLRNLVYGDPVKQDEYIKVYDECRKDHFYCVTVDVARGKEGDYSAVKVFDVTEYPFKDVFTYRNKEVDPLNLPDTVLQIARHYSNAIVLVETNDVGQQVADILFNDLEYENMLFTVNNPVKGVTVTAGFGHGSHPGVRTTKSVKKLGCSNFKSLVENDKLIINDYDTLEEMFRFVWTGSTYEAEEGNDDLVMCCVLFSWLTDQNYFRELMSKDIRKRFQEDNAKRLEDELTPFGIYDDSSDFVDNKDIDKFLRPTLDDIKPHELVGESLDSWLSR